MYLQTILTLGMRVCNSCVIEVIIVGKIHSLYCILPYTDN